MLKMDQKGLKIDYKGLKVVFFGLWIIDSAVFLAEWGGNPLPPFADNIFSKKNFGGFIYGQNTPNNLPMY